ncbi:S8 family serine peptidase [Chondromyces crocatus]|uniref:S8 family serine peptidase n=1 Tax=Chondromyces crocatus TaxID=52 RepID=UPI001FE0FC64|nr:S8 family serine peptidase [Chondromyces crocatus]
MGTDARSLGLLPVAPGFGSIRLAPSDVDLFTGGNAKLSLLAGPPRQALLDVSGELTRAASYRANTQSTGEGVVVGVIDTGFDLAHPDLRDATGKTRIAWMLQAGTPRGLHPALEDEFGCTDPNQTPCAILAASDIDALIASGEESLSDRRSAHGTHVLSIAAGNGGVMGEGTPRYVGVAPGATLVVVAPSLPGAGFRDADLLNATRFVFDRAEALGMPAVVNLSVGGDFGPHDGSSPLEQGLAGMVGEDKPGRVIVVAAGNSGTLYALGEDGPFGIHTEARVSPSSTVRVPIRSSRSKQGQGFVWITFRPDDEVSVGLEGPDGSTWVGLTDPGEDAGYGGGDEKISAAVINRIANGKSPITEATNSAVVAWDGTWEAGELNIVLEGKGDAQLWMAGLGDVSTSSGLGLLFVRALKQGTITVPASHPGLLAVGCTINRVEWTPFDSTQPLTISELGGAVVRPDGACFFSSAGPTPFGAPKPELSAPGGFVVGAMAASSDPREDRGGLFDPQGCPDSTPCFVVDDHHAITSGTSMSAPQVAGAVALLLERDKKRDCTPSEAGACNPTLTQRRVTEILQAGARYPGGVVPRETPRDPEGLVPHETQLGPGTLDVEGAMQVLEVYLERLSRETNESDSPSGNEEPIPPAVDRSWYVLSSSYARPDPTWPVWGHVELRRADGTVATTVDESKLRVQVINGLLVDPLTAVSHGMWRFAVAAPKGVYGTSISIDVLYDDVSLGTRELPVGMDLWTSSGDISATSAGCACSAGAPPSSPPPWTLAALGAALLGGRRLRRRPSGTKCTR